MTSLLVPNRRSTLQFQVVELHNVHTEPICSVTWHQQDLQCSQTTNLLCLMTPTVQHCLTVLYSYNPNGSAVSSPQGVEKGKLVCQVSLISETKTPLLHVVVKNRGQTNFAFRQWKWVMQCMSTFATFIKLYPLQLAFWWNSNTMCHSYPCALSS